MNGPYCEKVVPAWYELTLLSPSRIGLRVHKTALESMSKERWDKGAEMFLQKFNLREFISPCDGDCGFDSVFKKTDSGHQDWIMWAFDLPRIKEEFNSENGSASYVMAVRSSLHLIVSIALWLFEEETSWNQPQLLVVEGICLPTDRSLASGALSVSLLPPVMKWLAKTQQDKNHIVAIKDAMQVASEYMWPSNMDRYRFGAMFRAPKWLCLDVPGSACCLAPGDHYSESLEEGYTLHPHNVDSSLQQLTFIAGLARLHDLVRADV